MADTHWERGVYGHAHLNIDDKTCLRILDPVQLICLARLGTPELGLLSGHAIEMVVWCLETMLVPGPLIRHSPSIDQLV